MRLAVGVSTVQDGLAQLGSAYREASGALRRVAESGGVLSLPDLSAFEFLTLRNDDVARRLIAPEIERFVAEDREHGGQLIDTLLAYVDADLNAKAAAERLHIHVNTAHYRLGRIDGEDRLRPPSPAGRHRSADRGAADRPLNTDLVIGHNCRGESSGSDRDDRALSSRESHGSSMKPEEVIRMTKAPDAAQTGARRAADRRVGRTGARASYGPAPPSTSPPGWRAGRTGRRAASGI